MSSEDGQGWHHKNENSTPESNETLLSIRLKSKPYPSNIIFSTNCARQMRKYIKENIKKENADKYVIRAEVIVNMDVYYRFE